jgi:hypothetical protein
VLIGRPNISGRDAEQSPSPSLQPPTSDLRPQPPTPDPNASGPAPASQLPAQSILIEWESLDLPCRDSPSPCHPGAILGPRRASPHADARRPSSLGLSPSLRPPSAALLSLHPSSLLGVPPPLSLQPAAPPGPHSFPESIPSLNLPDLNEKWRMPKSSRRLRLACAGSSPGSLP